MEKIVSTKKWSATIRINHWVTVLSILILIGTGLYIARPFAASAGDTADKYLMGYMRFFHILFGMLLSFAFIWRVYLAFFSRFKADWKDFFAFLDFKNLVKQIKFYLLLSDEAPEEKYVYLPMQSLAYLGIMFMILAIIVTGFVLTGSGFDKGLVGFIYIFVKPLQTMLGLATVKFLHHIMMWFFILYLIVHVYMALWTNAVKKDGTLFSMINGMMLEKKK